MTAMDDRGGLPDAVIELKNPVDFASPIRIMRGSTRE
jgi:hypothetical protein